jgi:hypothetical protein
MAQPPTTEMSDFEKQRLANIAERDALLKQLTLDAQYAVFTKASTPKANGSSKKRPAPKRVAVKNETLVPRRTSSRLAGITADGEVAKRKADQEYEAAQDHARAKRQRISGDLGLGDILVAGNGTKGFLGDLEGMTKGIARPYERTFGDEEVKATGDKELKAMREKMSGLALWEPWEPNREISFPFQALSGFELLCDCTYLPSNQVSKSPLSASTAWPCTQPRTSPSSSQATS